MLTFYLFITFHSGKMKADLSTDKSDGLRDEGMNDMAEPIESEEKNRVEEQGEMKESLQVQKMAWIKEQTQENRIQEDQLLEQIKQEQLLLQNMDADINANMEHTREGRAYREEIGSFVENRVYEMHDLSQDKREGIREYQNAYHRGFCLAMFLLSTALTVFAGYLNGFGSTICVAMLAMTAMQSAVLVHNERGVWLFRIFGKLVSLLLFPAMLVLFVLYELQYPEYEWLLYYGVCVMLGLAVLFTLAYFLYDPYKAAKARIWDAKDTLRGLEKEARKQVRKNQKSRIKEEVRQTKQQQKEEAYQIKQQQKEAEKEERIRKRLHAHEDWMNKLEGIKTAFLQKFTKQGIADGRISQTDTIEELSVEEPAIPGDEPSAAEMKTSDMETPTTECTPTESTPTN